MAVRTANQAAEPLLPAGLLETETRATLLASPLASFLLNPADGQVLWSSHVAARLFGRADGLALMQAGLPVQAPGSLRLRQIGAQGNGPRRIERLRFIVALRSVMLTAICEFLPTADGGQVLAVALPDAVITAEDLVMPALAAPPALAAAVVASAPEPGHVVAADAVTTADAMAAPAAAEAGTAPAWLATDPAQRRMMRFVFALDRHGVVERVSPPLAQAVGSGQADIVGRDLAACIGAFDPAAGEAVRQAVASGETWPAIRTTWPVDDGIWAVPVTLNALPMVVAEEGLTGFSGFGRCELPAAIAVAQPAPLLPVPAIAEPALPLAVLTADEATDQAREMAGPATDAGTEAAAADETDEADHAASVDGSADDAATDAAVPDAVPADEDTQDVSDDRADAETAVATESSAEETATENDTEAEIVTDEAINIQDQIAAEDQVADQGTGAEAEPAPTPIATLPDEDQQTRDLIAALDAFTDGDYARDSATPAATTTPTETGTPQSAAGLANQLDNVIALRQGPVAVPPGGRPGLSVAEKNAFREIAKALGARLDPEFDALTGQDPGPKDASRNETLTARQPTGSKEPLPPASPTATAKASHAPTGTALLDHLPVGVLITRGEETLFANRTLLDLTDYPDIETFRAESGSQTIFRKSTLPRDRESGFDTVVLSTRHGEMIPVEAHLQKIDWDGMPASMISMRRAVELEQGKALRSVALDLKRIRNEAAELRAVLDTATDGVVTLDDRGLILTLNGAAEALFGLSQNEVAGEKFTTLLHNDSHADALDYFEGLRANGVRSVLNDGRDVQGREKKGGRIPLFMTLGRISDEEPRRFCAVLRDLTAWKRAEAELTEARRAAELASAKKSDFLTKISHEIRTPMNAIIGFAEVMIEERLGAIGNAKYKEYLDDIRTSGQHVVSLVNDLLDLAKIEAGRMEMRFEATDLNSVVSSCVGIIQPQANAHRVLVRTQLAQRLPAVVADERSIRQIVLNMLSNATRFTESGGQVIVATALLDTGEAVIRIRDTGIGMTATEIEQALEPFRQVGTRRDHGGTGLGLPLTKALVEANRANFVIRSTPGEGTMVEITFPSTRVLAE